jgi:Pyruvate/2-oxoacid:ferredoxin oxidoreductase delta subunit/flavodoxin
MGSDLMNKVGLFYFTGTGNTAQTVKEITKSLGDKGIDCKCFNIRDPHPSPSEFDIIGISYPVYAWAPPWPITEWIKSNNALKDKPCFVFQNFAGDPANAFRRILKTLKKTGARVFAIGQCLMIESWTTVRSQAAVLKLEQWYHEHKHDFGSTSEFAKNIVNLIKNHEYTEVTMLKYRFTWWNMISPFYTRPMLKISYRNSLDKSKCTKCGLCAKMCPTHSITLNPYPVFKTPCAGCFGCVNLCPTDAINSMLTKGKVRYKP